MICTVNNLGSHSGYARALYDREKDLIFLTPCCTFCQPKKLIEPFAFPADYFCEHIEECLEKYTNFEFSSFQEYYYGCCCPPVYNNGNKPTLSKSYACDFKNNLGGIQFLEISISRNCNLKCKKCHERMLLNKREEEIYLKVLDALKKIKKTLSIFFTTVGEPFIYKKQIFDFLKESCHTVSFITNGTLLNEKDIKELSKYKNRIECAIVSLDTFKKNRYEELIPNGDFKKVKETIILLKKYNLLTEINTVIQEENLDEIPFFLGLRAVTNVHFIMKDGNLEILKKIHRNLAQTKRNSLESFFPKG